MKLLLIGIDMTLTINDSKANNIYTNSILGVYINEEAFSYSKIHWIRRRR